MKFPTPTKSILFSFAKLMANRFNVNEQKVLEDVENVIINSSDVTFEDAKRFVKRLKENGHKLTILTYIPDKKNRDYQIKKIKGSGIEKYFDDIIITSEYKFTLDLDYKNSIFIDDDPRDLNGLYEKKPIKVIRIRKKNNKRSKIDIDNKKVKRIMLYMFAFFIPFFVLLGIIITLKVYPFGENTYMPVDAFNQYTPYLQYFKEAILGTNSMFYSLGKSIGGEMYGLFTYYLMSPFNLISLFFCYMHMTQLLHAYLFQYIHLNF